MLEKPVVFKAIVWKADAGKPVVFKAIVWKADVFKAIAMEGGWYFRTSIWHFRIPG